MPLSLCERRHAEWRDVSSWTTRAATGNGKENGKALVVRLRILIGLRGQKAWCVTRCEVTRPDQLENERRSDYREQQKTDRRQRLPALRLRDLDHGHGQASRRWSADDDFGPRRLRRTTSIIGQGGGNGGQICFTVLAGARN